MLVLPPRSLVEEGAQEGIDFVVGVGYRLEATNSVRSVGHRITTLPPRDFGSRIRPNTTKVIIRLKYICHNWLYKGYEGNP